MEMDNYGDMLVEDLIECDVEEIDGNSVWTEQALDLFMSQLKNANRHTFRNEQDMLKYVANKMAYRNFSFTFEQIESKFNNLRKMYTEKKERNQPIEQELVKLFGEIKPSTSKRQHSDDLTHSPKIPKVIILDESSTSPRQNKSADEDASCDENGRMKMIWSAQSNRFFLDLLEEHRPLLGKKFRTKRQMWEVISKRLKSSGYDITWAQVENKWKYLVRHYRNRLDMMRNNGKTATSPTSPSKSAFPEFYAPRKSTELKKPKEEDLKISFANDHKLPFDDDDEEENVPDENHFQFEEPCTLPEVEMIEPNNMDPVEIDVKPTRNELNSNDLNSKFDKITKELAGFRRDSSKYQLDLLSIKKQELEAYKERTVQFSKIGETLKELLTHMRSRDGHF